MSESASLTNKPTVLKTLDLPGVTKMESLFNGVKNVKCCKSLPSSPFIKGVIFSTLSERKL